MKKTTTKSTPERVLPNPVVQPRGAFVQIGLVQAADDKRRRSK